MKKYIDPISLLVDYRLKSSYFKKREVITNTKEFLKKAQEYGVAIQLLTKAFHKLAKAEYKKRENA